MYSKWLQCQGRRSWRSDRKWAWRSLLKLNTPLNEKIMCSRVEQSITLHTIRITYKYARSTLWIQGLAFLCRNVGPCRRAKNLKVVNWWFLTIPSFKRSNSLQGSVRNMVLDITSTVNGLCQILWCKRSRVNHLVFHFLQGSILPFYNTILLRIIWN